MVNEFINVSYPANRSSYSSSRFLTPEANSIDMSNKFSSWQFKTNDGKYLKTVVTSAENNQDSIVLSMVHKDKVLFKTLYDPHSRKFCEIPPEGSRPAEYKLIKKALTPEYLDSACRQMIEEAMKLKKIPTLLKRAVTSFKL